MQSTRQIVKFMFLCIQRHLDIAHVATKTSYLFSKFEGEQKQNPAVTNFKKEVYLLKLSK